MPKKLVYILIFFVGNKMFCQTHTVDGAMQYRLAPYGKDIDFYDLNLDVNYTLEHSKFKITNGIAYSVLNIDYNSNTPFVTESLNRFCNFSYGIQADYYITDSWGLGALLKAGLYSNFIDAISKDDVLVTGDVYAKKSWQDAYVTFGVSYNVVFGQPEWTPVFKFYKALNDQVEFYVGFPESQVRYKFNQKHALFVNLQQEGGYYNVSDYYNNSVALSGLNTHFTYQYGLDYNWAINLKAGYMFNTKYQLLDASNAAVYNFNIADQPFISAGLTFKMNTKNK